MPVSIPIQDAKHIKRILTFQQQKYLVLEKQMRKKLKDHPENFTVNDLDNYETAVVGIYEIGFVADRLEEFIREDESTNN
jgi:N-acetylglutamate synthase-like GNAT family acetyltransferase